MFDQVLSGVPKVLNRRGACFALEGAKECIRVLPGLKSLMIARLVLGFRV